MRHEFFDPTCESKDFLVMEGSWNAIRVLKGLLVQRSNHETTSQAVIHFLVTALNKKDNPCFAATLPAKSDVKSIFEAALVCKRALPELPGTEEDWDDCER